MIVLSNLLGLLFLLWLPILISIYFFRSRPVRYKVPSLFLWNKVNFKRQNRGFFEKFKNNLIFWLQLFFFALLFLALSKPYLREWERPQKLAYIIDNSGSMVARSGLFNTRLSRSIELARKHAKTFKDSNIEIYKWNTSLEKSLAGGSLEVKLSRIQATHLPNGEFFNLVNSIKDLVKKDYKVCLFTDSLEYAQQQILANLGVEIFLSAQDHRNIYFDSIDENSLNDGTLKFNVNIACTSKGGSGTLVISQKGSLPKRLPFNLGSYDKYQFDFEIKPTSILDSISFEIISDEPDSLPQDNLVKYFINPRVPAIKLSGFSKSSPFLKFFNSFLVADKRFQFSEQNFQIKFNKENGLPKNPKPFNLYVIGQNDKRVSIEEFKSHILESGHPLLRFVGGNNFFSAMEINMGKQIDDWESLIQIEHLSTKQSTPGLLIHKKLQACMLLNLEFTSQSIGNPDYPILFENILRHILHYHRMNSLVEVGSGFAQGLLQTGLKNIQDPDDFSVSKLTLQGAYRRSDGSNYFARFPVIESRLLEANRNPSAIAKDISLRDRGIYKSTEKENSKLTGSLILIAIMVMVFEWYLFSRRA